MALAFNYSNTAIETTLAGSISSAATTITVAATTGFPVSVPYVLAVGYGAADEELVKVTAAAGTDLTVERAFGDTSAQSHSLGAKVRHVVNAVDLIDFRQHEADASGVHGISGSVVGTTDAQSLSNKTLTSPAISAPTVTGGGSLAGTFTGAPDFSGAVAFSGAPSFDGAPVFTGDPVFTCDSAGDFALEVRQAADTGYRLAITGDGALNWGDGAGTDTVTLGRLGDDILYSGDTFRVERGVATDDAFTANVTGDAFARYVVEASGKTFWGNGAVAADTHLERTGVAALATNATFSAEVETSTSFSVASGFSVNTAELRKTCGVCTVSIYVQLTSAIATSSDFSPNIPDTVMGTLPSGFRPAYNHEASWSTGLESGSAEIGTGGVITLRTSDYSTGIPDGSNLRVSATYVL